MHGHSRDTYAYSLGGKKNNIKNICLILDMFLMILIIVFILKT